MFCNDVELALGGILVRGRAPPPPNPPSVSDSRDPYCCHVSGIFMQRKERYNGCHCPFVMSQKAPDPPRPGYGTSF